MALTREQILNRTCRAPVDVQVPEWDNETIYIRYVTGKEKAKIMSRVQEMTDENGFKSNEDVYQMMVLVLVFTLSDEQGNRLFTEEDVEALMEKEGNILEQLYTVASIQNGLGAESLKTEVKN